MQTSPANDIAEHLASEGFGTLGVELHVSESPQAPNKTITLFDRGGPGPDPQNLAEEVAVQIVIRDRGFREVYDLAWKIRDALLGEGPLTLSGKRYDVMWLEGDLILLGHDERDRVELSMNIRAMVFPPSGEHRS